MNTTQTRPFAVVTGASSGIGYELAKQFIQNGFDLLITAESDRIASAAELLQKMEGARVQSIKADLSTFEGVEELHRAILSADRPLSAIAINAGVGVSGDFARSTDLQDELNLINLNVIAPVHLAKRVLPDMLKAKGGRVLFTSSIAGTMPAPFEAIYGASKAFLTSFAQAIRNELKDTGITITVLMPGATETPFFSRAGMEDTKLGAAKKDDPADVAREGFEAMMAGDDHVVAGSFKNKVQAAGGHLLPDPLVAAMHRSQSEPGSANK